MASNRAKWSKYLHIYITCNQGVNTPFCDGNHALVLRHQVWTAPLVHRNIAFRGQERISTIISIVKSTVTQVTNLPGDDVALVIIDISFTNRIKILWLIPSTAHALEASDFWGVPRDDEPSAFVPHELVSMATSPTATSNSGRTSSLLKCISIATSRFPLQALSRLIAIPSEENEG